MPLGKRGVWVAFLFFSSVFLFEFFKAYQVVIECKIRILNTREFLPKIQESGSDTVIGEERERERKT